MITLGINHSNLHDSAAAIVRDGEPLFAIAEERLSKRKHDGNFPQHAIRACLDYAGVGIGDVDVIINGWQPMLALNRVSALNRLKGLEPGGRLNLPADMLRWAINARGNASERLLDRHFGSGHAPLRRIDHHYAHALSAYVPSAMDEATVVVIDGRGAWEASSIWHGKGDRLEHVETVRWPNSLGLFYAAFTGFLGFEKYADEWKVMGLAPFGTPGAVDLSPFVAYGDGHYQVRSDMLLPQRGREYAAIERHLGEPRTSDYVPLTQRDRDIAWAVQDMCERVECDFIAGAIRRTGCRNLCIAGGVGLNSKANGLFLQQGLCDRIFIQPAAGDDGIALGAALAPDFERGVRKGEQMSAYLGPSYTRDQVRAELDKFKIRYEEVDEPAKAAAQLLADNLLVGWFQGREEYGPRALGHRSILADPGPVENRDRVNNAVKFREEWRPFAPSVLEEHCDALFENYQDSPFMILTFAAKEAGQQKIAAAIHVDNSARVQTVRKGRNDIYYDMISEFYALTGTPAVMNTSFNLKGEVIVNTVFDAVRTFYTSGLDALVIENFVIRK